MARAVRLDQLATDPTVSMSRAIQSGRLNFLIGSGASRPAIAVAPTVEKEIAELIDKGDLESADRKMYEFLCEIERPTRELIDDAYSADTQTTLSYYEALLLNLEALLTERRTTLLHRQCNIFSTNYDLFVEKAALKCTALKLNDGFTRAPGIVHRMILSTRSFFDTTFNTGQVYNYKVELPALNLIKLHGSLSWAKPSKTELTYRVAHRPPLPAGADIAAIRAFLDEYAVVLPRADKFRATIIDRTYYELLRIYANELDRENCLLVAFGFSFEDEHILDITKRALKNPTLRLVVFAFDEAAQKSYEQKFASYNNAIVVFAPPPEMVTFDRFSEVFRPPAVVA